MTRLLRTLALGLSLLLSMVVVAQSTKWQDIYTVKKKDTIYGIANKYGITIPDLMAANPAMTQPGYVLQKGSTLFIPFAKPQTPASPAAQQQAAAAQSPQQGVIRVGVMLPLHDVDGDGRRMVEYYRGLLMGIDDLKREGYSVEVRAWNVPIDADIRQTLLKQGASKCHIIFGPLYTRQVAALGDFCRQHDIKMVIPFSIESHEVVTNPQVFQVYQSPDALSEAAVKAFINRFGNAHPVFIDCNDKTSTKGKFTYGLRKELEARGIAYKVTNLTSSLELFAKAFDRSKQNVVVLNTGRSPELTQALDKLDGLNKTYPGLVMSLYGYTEWLMYTRQNTDRFFRYDTYIPSTFYYNAANAKVRELEAKYRQFFHADMMVALPRFAITGFDHAQFFLRGLRRHGSAFTGSRVQQNVSPLQVPLRFERIDNGGYQNRAFQLVHYTFNRQIEALGF